MSVPTVNGWFSLVLLHTPIWRLDWYVAARMPSVAR